MTLHGHPLRLINDQIGSVIKIIACTAVLLAWTSTVEAVNVTVMWDASPEQNVSGYRLSYGTQSGQYSTTIDAGNATSRQISLSAGQRYYFAVQAYDPDFVYSPYSAEVTIDLAQPLTVAFVQMNYAAPQSAQTVVTVPYTAAQTSGNLNLIAVGWNDSTTQVQSVTDSAGNVYVRAVGPTVQSGMATQSIYYAANIASAPAGGNTVTVTFTAAARLPDIRIAEYTGVDPVSPVDVTAAAQGNGTTSDSGAVMTANVNDLVVGANLVQTGTAAAGEAYNNRVVTSPRGNLLEDLIAATVGSYGATASLSSSGGWIMQMVAFRAGSPSADRAPTLSRPANQTSAENASVSLQLVASDPDGDALTYSATGLPPALSVNTTSGLISGTLPYTTAGTYNVTATASDGRLTSSQTFTWTVTNVNRAPTLTAPPNQTSAENATVSLQLVASDPDGDAVTYNATGLPSALTVNTTTGLISGTLSSSSAGTYSVTATAADASLNASRTFTWTVTPLSGTTSVDLAPQDTFASLDGVSYATDPTLNTYTWPANQVANAILMKFGLSQIPATATIQSATLYANLVEADAYTAEPSYTVALHKIINHNPDLTRATGATYDGVNAWTANACCYGNVPMAQADISAPRSTAAVDRTLGFKTWDATSIVQEWLASPATNFGVLLNGDTSKGADRYRYFASTESGVSAQRPYLHVTYSVSGSGNRAPALTNPGNQTSAENATVSLQLVASDPDGDTLTYSATGLPPALTVNTASGLISGTLPSTSAGTYTVTATASDGSQTSSKTFTWTVTNVNRAPTLTAPSNQTSAENATVSLQLVASDPDGDTLTYSATGLPPALTVNATSGLISGTLSSTSAGTYSVTATASDASLASSKTFTWTVTNANRAPTLTPPPNQTSAENATVSLQLVASDPDGDALTYSATGLPPALTVNATTGAISGTLSYAAAGTYSVTATASDGRLASSQTFTWTVTNVNRAPTLTAPPNQTSTANTAVSLQLVASDPDGDTLTYSATGLPPALTVNATSGLISGTLPSTSAGTYSVTATASDSSLASSKTFTWTVTNVNRAPTLTAPPNQTNTANTAVSLQLIASDPDGDALTYSATGLPPGLTVNASTGLISGTLPFTSVGVYPVTATVSDGNLSNSKSFVWTVLPGLLGPSSDTSNPESLTTPAPFETIWVYDTFTAVDGTNAQGRVPETTGTSADWQVWGTPGAELRNNQLRTTGVGLTWQAATVETAASDVTLNVDWVVPASSTPFGGVVVRATDDANYILVRYWQGQLQIFRQQRGEWTAVGSAVLVTATPGSVHRLTVTAAGTTLVVGWDGTPALTVVEPFNQSATRHGVNWAPFADALTAYDNFDVRVR